MLDDAAIDVEQWLANKIGYTAEITFDAPTGRIDKRAWFGASSAELQPVDSYVEHFFGGAADVLWAACGERHTVAATSSATGSRIVSREEPGSGDTVHGVVLGREGKSSITLRCEDPTQQAATRASPPPPPLSLLSGATVVQPTRVWYKIFPAGVRSRIIGRFQTSGGRRNDIEAVVATQAECVAWIQGRSTEVLYSSGRVTSGQIDVTVPYAGSYCVAFSNAFSLVSAKHVSADITLHYESPGSN